MAFLQRCWVFVARCFIWAVFHIGWMKFISTIYRWLYERQWKDVAIKTYSTMASITAREKPDWWRADGVKQLFDACSSPQYVEAVWSGLAPQPTEGFDCDEFAVYAVHAAKASLLAGVMTDPVSNPRILSVTWTVGFKSNGHNVCLVEVAMPGRPRQYAFIDYGLLSKPQDSIDDVARLVESIYAPGCDSLGWSVFAPDLTRETSAWGA